MDERSAAGGSAPLDRPRWHDAADRAGFTFFEPVSPGRTSVWAGGFGCEGRDATSHLGVVASIDGVEVQVDTTRPGPRVTRDARVRAMVHDLVFHHVWDSWSDLELPLTIEVVADDRMIAVAGLGVLFSGVRVPGSGRWTGEVEHGDAVIRAVTPERAPAFAIEPCRDWSGMAELPPPGGPRSS
jgi:hypothetical protein